MSLDGYDSMINNQNWYNKSVRGVFSTFLRKQSGVESHLKNFGTLAEFIRYEKFINLNYVRGINYTKKNLVNLLDNFIKEDSYVVERDLIESLKDYEYQEFKDKINPLLRI